MLLTAISGVVLAIMFSLTVTQATQGGDAEQLAGAWRTEITLRNCQTGAAIRTFPALNTFVPGGAFLGTSGGASPALFSNSVGVWQHTGGQHFTSTATLFRFNPDGTYAGTQKFTRTIVLGPDANEFTSTNTTEILDPSGTVIGTGCSTEAGRRLE
jgi:hypothetical protein